jgi:hypothetical protein
VYLDWCEATVSHPFFSAVRFLASARFHSRAVREDPVLFTRLRDAYLRPWSGHEPAVRLVEAYELAWQLQPLQYALTYWHLITQLRSEGLASDAWERRSVAAASLRRLLVQPERLTGVGDGDGGG